ncbi:MAG: hypothetical protein WD045_01500 [Pirellulaceae bacterium]
MFAIWVSAGILLGMLGLVVMIVLRSGRLMSLQPKIDPVKAKQLFQIRREWLEAEFMKKAAATGKPRGLRWVDCDFESNAQFAEDEQSNLLRAFVSVTIRFEAIEGGGMEEVEAVSNLRAATAVFEYDGEKWVASPRTIFNLSPDQAIEQFRHRPVSAD